MQPKFFIPNEALCDFLGIQTHKCVMPLFVGSDRIAELGTIYGGRSCTLGRYLTNPNLTNPLQMAH